MARRAKMFLPPAAKLDATVVLCGKGEKFYRVTGILTVLQPLPARSAGEHTHFDRILNENYRIAYSPQIVTLD
ncbi:MAG TPA: hypothetical protein DGA22_08585 [Acidobacterium sp.]|nr:hypothetical protein [Acidobacterium sp.]